jgi:3-oxoacyl-[acyl-carrier protein] reductase
MARRRGINRQWACEFGPAVVRVAWLRTGGFREPIRRLPSLAEAAAFMASDRARSVTATAINLTAGAVAD